MDFSGNKKRNAEEMSENDEEELKFEERDVLPGYDNNKSPISSLISSNGT